MQGHYVVRQLTSLFTQTSSLDGRQQYSVNIDCFSENCHCLLHKSMKVMKNIIILYLDL
jgi:hypothetical protein